MFRDFLDGRVKQWLRGFRIYRLIRVGLLHQLRLNRLEDLPWPVGDGTLRARRLEVVHGVGQFLVDFFHLFDCSVVIHFRLILVAVHDLDS